MSLAAIVQGIESRGVRIRVREDGALAVRPPGALTPSEREVIQALKADVIAYLRSRDLEVDWTRIRLQDLDRVLVVTVPWVDIPLVIAPGCRLARELRDSDSKPGRVWCVCEVLDLLLANVPPEQARTTADVKLVFGGIVAGVRREHGS